MKHEKALSCLTAGALALCLGFGGVACMVTGLKLDADLGTLGFWCALSAVAVAVGFAFCRSKVVWGAVGALSLLMAMSPDFFFQWRSMLSDILRYYQMGYGLAIPAWLQGVRDYSHVIPLLMVAVAVMTLTAWSVLRQKSAVPAVAAALVPLASCLVVTDTVPAEFAILIWLFGVTMLLMTAGVRRYSRTQSARLAAILALPVAASLALLMTLVPQEGFQGPTQVGGVDHLFDWVIAKLPSVDRTFEGELVISVGSTARQKVDLSTLGRNDMPTTPVMEVLSERGGTLFLRGRSYDVYDGKGWTATADQEEKMYPPDARSITSEYQVSVKMLSKRGQFYLPSYPAERQSLSGGMLPNPTYEMEYTFPCVNLKANWTQYMGSDSKDLSIYLALPEQTRQRAEVLLEKIETPLWQINSVAVTNDIEAYVRKSAAYDLKTGRMPGSETDFAMWFLEQSDTGYCVHFATAATVLLRAAGIPARYVEGYVVDAQPDQTTLVRENNAHAWVEYYVPGIGWVILDPTPAAEETTTEPTQTEPPETTEPTVTEPSETSPTQPSEEDPTEPSASDPTGPTGGTTPGEEPKKELPRWFAGMLLWFAGIAVAVAAVMGQRLLRLRLKKRRMRQGRPNTQALHRFREVRLVARLQGISVPKELEQLAEKARFSQHTLTKEELAQFDTFLREGTAALEQRPWYLWLIYRFVYAVW